MVQHVSNSNGNYNIKTRLNLSEPKSMSLETAFIARCLILNIVM